MKSKVLIVIALVALLTVPLSVFAATSDAPVAKTIRGFFGIDLSKLTDQQKADITEYNKKMADLQKEFINKMVENGTMTKEQGDTATKKIDEAIKNGDVGSFIGGMGKGGFGGHGKREGFGFGGIDLSKLTDQQKTYLKDSYKKAVTLQKEYVNKMVASGLMTKEQGEAANKRLDESVSNIEQNGVLRGMGMLLGGFDCIGMKGIDTSKLTDQQKADLKDYSQKMANLQKEVINKLVTDGVITKEQGDAAAKRIDEIAKIREENGFLKGSGMKKGGFRGRGMKGGADTGVSTSAGATSAI